MLSINSFSTKNNIYYKMRSFSILLLFISTCKAISQCDDSCVPSECLRSMFVFTAYPGTIDENREICLGLGGDLLQHSIGPDGSAYHSAINTLVSDGHNAGYKYPRIGLTDRGKVGTWRFMDGDSYNPHDRTQTAAFYWGAYQPSSQGEVHCASAFAGSPNYLDDVECFDNRLAICEIKYYVC